MSTKYSFSYWEQTSLLARPDVCIIGAGLTGLQTALAIKKEHPNLDVLVVERGPFSRGASTRNAGFACFGSPTELLEDLENGAADSVWQTVEKRYRGIKKLEAEFGQNIHYHNHGGYEVFTDSTVYAQTEARLHELNPTLKEITGAENVWHAASGTPGLNPTYQLLFNRLEGQLHPGLLVSVLEKKCHAMGIRLLFGVNVTHLEENDRAMKVFLQEGGHFTASQVVLTTNAFTPDLLPKIDVVPARNQVLITGKIPGLQLRGCFHQERGYIYFRNVGPDRLLIGGARHLAKAAEETTEFGANDFLLDFLAARLQSSSVDVKEPLPRAASWSGIIAQGSDKSPIIQRISERQIVAVRLAGMGVAMSGTVAEAAARLL